MIIQINRILIKILKIKTNKTLIMNRFKNWNNNNNSWIYKLIICKNKFVTNIRNAK